MDKKRTISAIVATLLVVGLWMWLQSYLNENYPLPPATDGTAPTTASTSQPATTTATTNTASTNPATAASVDAVPGTPPATLPANVPVISAGPGVPGVADPAGNDKPVALGNAARNATDYAMQVQLSPIGAGIDAVTLNHFFSGQDFQKKPADRAVYQFQQPYAQPTLAFTRPLATRNITIIDSTPGVAPVTVELASARWSLAKHGPVTVELPSAGNAAAVAMNGQIASYEATVELPGADGKRVPTLRLTKTFHLFQSNSVTKGYEVWADQTVENLTGRKLSVAMQINGPTLPPRESNAAPDRHVFAGYLLPTGVMEIKEFSPSTFSAVVPGFLLHEQGPKPTDKGAATLQWMGTSSVYFDAFVLMADASKYAGAIARQENAGNKDIDPENREIVTTFQTVNLDLPEAAAGPAAKATVGLRAYFGPRWRSLLDDPYYAAAPRGFNQTLIVKSGPCSSCAFDWLINGMVWLLNTLHFVARDWGIAIILLVAIVRTCLHPITKRSQVQMMKMGKMGPELQKLKEKYGDDKEAFAKAQMQLMKEQGFAPILGCLPMFLQMPIWIALWQALQSTFELRQAAFLWNFTWIHDLSKPDYLINFGQDIPLVFGLHLDGINLLPLLLAVIFHVQARIQNSLTPASTPEQEQQKKMMMWMSTFLFPLFLYNGPSGLNLYILTSTLVGIVESKIIRDHIKQREAAEKAAGPVIVDAPLTRSARKAVQEKPGKAEPPKGGLGGFLSRMQAKVEELQKEQDKRKKKE
jgi:YidC/Oxa1 family membrane protein insertase